MADLQDEQRGEFNIQIIAATMKVAKLIEQYVPSIVSKIKDDKHGEISDIKIKIEEWDEPAAELYIQFKYVNDIYINEGDNGSLECPPEPASMDGLVTEEDVIKYFHDALYEFGFDNRAVLKLEDDCSEIESESSIWERIEKESYDGYDEVEAYDPRRDY